MDSTSTMPSNTHLTLRDAQYVHMSTEHQQYSPENQLEIIPQYAAAHQMEIVREYADHGRTGLNIAGREGLSRLMEEVEAKRINFSALLVYDVSRWGRFQDVDESAYYEYVLKRAGVRVHYCAEQFENDGSMSSSVLKTLKRSMAAEYDRRPWGILVVVHSVSELLLARHKQLLRSWSNGQPFEKSQLPHRNGSCKPPSSRSRITRCMITRPSAVSSSRSDLNGQ